MDGQTDRQTDRQADQPVNSLAQHGHCTLPQPLCPHLQQHSSEQGKAEGMQRLGEEGRGGMVLQEGIEEPGKGRRRGGGGGGGQQDREGGHCKELG